VLFDRTPKNRFDIIIEIVRNLAPDKVALQFHIRIHSMGCLDRIRQSVNRV